MLVLTYWMIFCSTPRFLCWWQLSDNQPSVMGACEAGACRYVRPTERSLLCHLSKMSCKRTYHEMVSLWLVTCLYVDRIYNDCIKSRKGVG